MNPSSANSGSSPQGGDFAALPIGLQFTETMRGYVSTQVQNNYEVAAEEGKQGNSACEFTVTITSDDLKQMLEDPSHKAAIEGSATVPALSAVPLRVERGDFHLFEADPNNVETHLMRYNMLLADAAGRYLFLEGFKVVHNDGVTNIWHDTSTLYFTIFDGDNGSGVALGKGILHILPSDFAYQLTTVHATNAPNAIAGLAAEARFGHFFAGTLFDTYGGVFAKSTAFNPDAPARKKRPLKVGAPEVHFFLTNDNKQLRLTRYKGGGKGPVVLAHGLGVSSLIFSIDTIDTNLLEFLFADGFDVWLLDFRASIELPCAKDRFTADDVARRDYPAAVQKVCELTGAGNVQMVVHCYGATTFTMAMCAGLKGVRSAVISQISAHITAPTVNRIRTGLHLPDFLDKLGIEDLNAYTSTQADWQNKLYDKALALYPVGERCQNPVCHRITFMYAPLYRHEQLNEATHEALHEMFGIANILSFEGLGLMTRKGHIVAADGAEDYLPHLDRLAIPITFIHGEENECFLPKSTEITFDKLSQTNGANLYKRHVIPGFGHIDCIFGKDAAREVFPFIREHLNATL